MKTTTRKHSTHTLDEKLEVVKLHNQGYSLSNIARELHISISVVQRWINHYKTYGTNGLDRRRRVRMTDKLKITIIRDVIDNSLTNLAAALKYDISETSIRLWKQKVLASGYDILTNNTTRTKQSDSTESFTKQLSPAKIKKLQKEVLILKMENARLKRSFNKS